jgi:N-acetylglucosamine kinase-like BadF-type ATPase
MSIVLGVDAGNTKTIAIVAREDGDILGWGRSGCGDIYGAGEHAALDAVATASFEALRAANLSPATLSGVLLSAAGADWPEDFETIRDGAIARGLRPHPIVYNDAIGGLRAGSPDGTGVVVVCGTGVAIGSRAIDGRLWHSSFWQGPQGGDFLGKAAFNAMVQAELGVAPQTALTPAILHHFNAGTVEAALHLCTARTQSHPPMKPLAKVLFDVAAQGDDVAIKLVTSHGQALGDYALVAAHKVGIEREPFHLVLTGGVLRHPSALMRDAIIARVREASPGVNVIHDAMEPALGAVMLALEHAHIAITPAVRARLQMTAPPTKVFET